jgi:DNA-binding XRE family transcriptional regulator
MPSTKKWSEIRATRSKPGVLEAAEKRRAKRALLLGEVRRARHPTQEALAQSLGISQSEVSKVERRTDIYVTERGLGVTAACENAGDGERNFAVA